MVAKAQCDANFTYTVDSATIKATFTNTSLGDSLKFIWSFGDGTPLSADTSPVHQFAQNGWYYICLNIINADSSCRDVKCEFVRVYKRTPEPCRLAFSYQYDTADNKVVKFMDESAIDTPSNVLWVIGDSTIGTTKQFSIRFPALGNYKVCMLQGSLNCADSICKTIEILEILPACVADFTVKLFADSVSGTSRIARFNNASTGDKALSYLWKFGDGNTSVAANPIHYYAKDGNYMACLQIKIGNLCSDSICTMIEVKSSVGINKQTDFIKEIKVYPLPFQNFVKLEITGLEKGKLLTTLLDITGKQVSYWVNEVDAGSDSFLLDMPPNLNAGVYILQMRQNGNQKAIKLWK